MIGRAAAMLLAVSACTRTWNPKANLGTDGKWRGAHLLELHCHDDGSCSTSRRDVVTWRGGDRIDWYVVDLPPSTCSGTALDIRFQWEAARGPKQFVIDALVPNGKRNPSSIWRKRGLAGAHTHLDDLNSGPLYLRIAALDRDAAGTYRLHVSVPDDGCPLVADIYQPRPDQLTLPAGTIAVLSAGMTRDANPGRWWSMPSIVLDASDPSIRVGSRGALLDPEGRPRRDAEIEVMNVWSPDVPTGTSAPRFAAARLIHPAAFKRRLQAGWDLWSVSLAPVR